MLQQQGGLPVRDGFAPLGKSASGWREGKGRVRTCITRSSLIAFLTLLLVELVVDRPVLEPPVLDAIDGVDARPVVLDG